MLLIVLTPLTSAVIDPFDSEEDEIDTGESVLLNVRSYEPTVLTSNLIEDNNIPVYAFLAATSIGTLATGPRIESVFGGEIEGPNLEPIYGGFEIDNIKIRPADIGTQDMLLGQPQYEKPKVFTHDNAGYIKLMLKQVEQEAEIPDEINMTFNAEVWFSEVVRLYNLAQTTLVLPVDSDYDDWEQGLETDGSTYTFFGNRGLIRVRAIEGNEVLLTVYSNKDLYWPIIGAPRAISDIKLSGDGDISEYIDLGETDEAALGMAKFRVRLDDVKDASEEKAVFVVDVDGELQNVVVTEGMSLYPGSSWKVESIYYTVTNEGKEQTVVLKKGGNRKTITTTTGSLQEEVSPLLNSRFYSDSMRSKEKGFFYNQGNQRISSALITEMTGIFEEYGIYVDTSAVKGNTAYLNPITISQGDTLKEVLYNVLPNGYYFQVDEDSHINIKYYDESDPCLDLETYDTSETVFDVSEEYKYNTVVLRKLLCTSIQEYRKVIDDFPNIKADDSLVEDEARFGIADAYEDLSVTYEDDDQGEKQASINQAINVLEGIKDEINKPEALAEIERHREGLISDTVYGKDMLEDNNKDVYVELREIKILQENDKPSVTLVKDGVTRSYFLGASIFSQNEKVIGEGEYNWMVYSINEDSVVFKKYYIQKDSIRAKEITESISLGDTEIIEDSSFKIVSTDTRKEAQLTIIPGTGKSFKSSTNFTIHIPVEKRLIELNPDKIDDRIEKAKNLQEKLDKNIEALDKILKTWNKVCYGVFAFIELKLLFSSSSASARHDVIRGVDDQSGWYGWCAEQVGYNNKYSNVDECLLDNAAEIQSNIEVAEAAWKDVQGKSDFSKEEWYGELVEGYGGKENMERCRGNISDNVFPDDDTIKELAYANALKGKVNDNIGVDSYLGTYGDLDVDSTYYLQKQGGCEDALIAMDALEAEYKAKGEELPATELKSTALAAYQSGVQEVVNKAPVVNGYPGEGLNNLVEKSSKIKIKNVGTALKQGNSMSFVVYDDGIKQNVAPLKYSQLMKFFRGDYVPDELKDVLEKEAQEIDDWDDVTQQNEGVTTTDGSQIYYREESGNLYLYAAVPGYATGDLNTGYADDAHFVIYGSGEYKNLPYCVPYPSSSGDFIKVLEYTKNNEVLTLQFWNVGIDGELCTGDDILVRHQSQFAYEDAYGTGDVPSFNSLYGHVNKYLKTDFSSIQTIRVQGSSQQFKIRQDKGLATYEGSTSSCFDVMEPNDCKLLFNVCDPVMCPPSRFNLGGRWQVDNVIESGMIGSIVLGMGNGDAFPICMTGIQANLHYWQSMLDAYVECLEAAKFDGETVGICDKMRSVYICEILVNEVAAIFDSKGGVLNFLGDKLFGGKDVTGGEYLQFKENLQNTEDAFTYFTTEYSQTAFGAFKGRSFKEVGGEICKQAVYGKMPAFDDFMGKLSQPEDPTQFFADLTTRPYSETTGQSAYQLYYHIYAGQNENIQRIVYSVQLRNSLTDQIYYMTEACGGFSGTIENGGMSDETLDCIAPTGFDEVCVVINGDRTCGFGQVSTMFSMNYMKDMVVADEAKKNISSETDCYPSVPTASPTVSQVGSFGLTDSLVTPYEFGLFTDGTRRVCSLENPGMGQGNSNDWKAVGSCGTDNGGRSLGYCWMDTSTLTIKDAQRSDEVNSYLDGINYQYNAQMNGIDELYDETRSQEEFERIYSSYDAAKLAGTTGCASLTSIPPQLSDFLMSTMSFEYGAKAQYTLGSIYTDIIRDCGIEGSKDVKVRFYLNGDEVIADSEIPIEAESEDVLKIVLEHVTDYDSVTIPGCQEAEYCSGGVDSDGDGMIDSEDLDCEDENNYVCTIEVGTGEQKVNVEVLLNGDVRYDNSFTVTTEKEEVAVLETNSCGNCGLIWGLGCDVDECHAYGDGCFYYGKGTKKCRAYDEIESCVDLQRDEAKCESSTFTSKAGYICDWDYDINMCVASSISSIDFIEESMYEDMYLNLKYDLDRDNFESLLDTTVDNICNKYKDRYEIVSQQTGVPWPIIAIIHYRESSLNFNTYLHNGQELGKTTTIVPEGIYFDEWEEAAVDAIENYYLDNLESANNDYLDALERYNGLGYRNKGLNSPYLWSGSTYYDIGKYVGDGNYDSNYVDKQLGTLTILKKMQETGCISDLNLDTTIVTEDVSCISLSSEWDKCVDRVDCYLYSDDNGYLETSNSNLECFTSTEFDEKGYLDQCSELVGEENVDECDKIENRYICEESCGGMLYCEWDEKYKLCVNSQ